MSKQKTNPKPEEPKGAPPVGATKDNPAPKTEAAAATPAPVAQTEHRTPAVAARFDFLKRQFGKRQGPDTRHERAKCEQAVKEYIAMGGDAADAKALRALADNTYGTL